MYTHLTPADPLYHTVTTRPDADVYVRGVVALVVAPDGNGKCIGWRKRLEPVGRFWSGRRWLQSWRWAGEWGVLAHDQVATEMGRMAALLD